MCQRFSSPRLLPGGLVLCSSLIVSACSGEPSGADIEKAFSRQISTAYQAAVQAAAANPRGMQAEMMKGVSEKDFKGQIHDLKKLACSKGETSVNYTCQIEIDMTLPLLGQRVKKTEQVKLIKGSDGWQIAG